MTDFFVPPVRTDATETDPYDTLEPGLVIRPETDAEIAARQATEPPPPAPDPDPESRQLSLLHRLVEKAGSVARAAVGAAVDAAERVLPKPQAYGIECRNGYIIQFTGQEDGKTLAARRQHLLDNRSASSVESVADGKVYQLMKEYCDGLPDDTPVKARDLFLSVADALREPHFLIATPWLSPAELESIFRPGRYVDDAMGDYHDLTLARRDADTLFRAGHRRLPPSPAIAHDESIAAIYGRQPRWGS